MFKVFGIPYRYQWFETKLNPLEIEQIIEKLVWNHTPYFWLNRPQNGKQFVGRFSFQKFTIQLITRFSKNLYKPILYGTIMPLEHGSIVFCTVTIEPFNGFMMVAANSLCLYLVFASKNIIPILFALIIDLLFYQTGFVYEADRLESDFLGSLKSDSETNSNLDYSD